MPSLSIVILPKLRMTRANLHRTAMPGTDMRSARLLHVRSTDNERQEAEDWFPGKRW